MLSSECIYTRTWLKYWGNERKVVTWRFLLNQPWSNIHKIAVWEWSGAYARRYWPRYSWDGQICKHRRSDAIPSRRNMKTLDAEATNWRILTRSWWTIQAYPSGTYLTIRIGCEPTLRWHAVTSGISSKELEIKSWHSPAFFVDPVCEQETWWCYKNASGLKGMEDRKTAFM